MTEQRRRKLIEVALPLEAINRESAREKSIRHGHPSTLHLWWARRPLAACRAVLFAQLVDDPSARPDLYPAEEERLARRKELFELIERLVVWENTNDDALLKRAHAEILASTGDNPPAILDPFAGGGSIPLEAQRLGLEAHASDLNPVAVLINKALIEIPPKWAGRPPVFPGTAESRMGEWPRATGLAEDVRRYGQWMRDEAEKRIGHLYPKAKLPDGTMANVIAWIWARTVACPNPACGAEIPLVSTWWLSKKKNRPRWIQPIVTGKHLTFKIETGEGGPPDPTKRGRGAKFTCVVCTDTTTDTYIKAEAIAGRMGARLIAIVAEGGRQRIYLPATDEHVNAADVAQPVGMPEEPLANDPRNIWCVNYGLTTFADLFTVRQLTALATFSELVAEARGCVALNAKEVGLSVDETEKYADTVALYLAFGVSNAADDLSSLVSWRTSHGTGATRSTFARQALPMVWDFAEANPFARAAGDLQSSMAAVSAVLDRLPDARSGLAWQADAQRGLITSGAAVSTDPPYYDNISYADLSDFFYIWLRRSLGSYYPDLTGTMLTPKLEELIATPYRFGGSKAMAEEHFERGFVRAFTRIREHHIDGIPITVFYAFKQAESSEGDTASTGWETMLNGLIEAGLAVTATWPMRTERSGRTIDIVTNALASSVVLACRPRIKTAEATSRRGFLAALKAELPVALRELQQGSIAPVDLAQAAIGPGMAVYTRYSRVVEADGSDMTVRTALALINHALDEVLSAQEGDFDADTRFCIRWFSQFGWNEAGSGEADVLARATNTSIDGLVRGGVFKAVAGRARLLGPEHVRDDWDPTTDARTSAWEAGLHLAKRLDERGVDDAAALMQLVGQRMDLDTVKELAYYLYSVCERKGWTQTALLFNGLGTSWLDLESATRRAPAADQGTLDYSDDDG